MVGIRSRLWRHYFSASEGDLKLPINVVLACPRYNFSKRNPYPRDDGQSKIKLIQLKTWRGFIGFNSLINSMIACA